MERKKIISFKGMKTNFTVRGKILSTIRNVDFDIFDGELVAIVGESGSGKSVLTKTVTSMLDSNGFIKAGSIKYYPTQLARDDLKANFREPLDLVDIHRAITSKSTYKQFSKVLLIQAKRLTKELKRIEKLKREKVESTLVYSYEKLTLLQEEITHFKYRKSAPKKIDKFKKLIKRYVYFKNILDSDDFKQKEVTEIQQRIKKLTEDTQFYEPLSENKRKLLKAVAKIFEIYLETKEYNEEELNNLKTQIEEQEVLWHFEEEVLQIIESIFNKKENSDDLKIIIKKAHYMGNKNRINKKNGKKSVVKLRGATVAVIPQDPMTSLNPLLSVGRQISEVLIKHSNMNRKEAKKRSIELLEEVGIPNAHKRYKDIPGEYSGGMRQRVVIAIALACEPRILVCDEPTTALDVTVQANILKLIRSLQRKHKFTTIFITHDLGVVANIADRVAVMYAGQIIEYGTTKEIFYNPQHPYTWALLSSLPQLGEKGEDLYTIFGNPPSLNSRIDGDAFAPRNEFALEVDFIEEPPMLKVSETHYAKTWLLDKRTPEVKPPNKIVKLRKQMQNRKD